MSEELSLQLYKGELEGQKDFYKTYLPRVDKNLTEEQIQKDFSDGVVNGNIIEFKLQISDLNAVLFQTIKYLSVMRIKGEPVPANILLVSLNTTTAYLLKSNDYLKSIEKVYVGKASKENVGFIANEPERIFNYGKSEVDESDMIKLLRSKNYIRIHIDENCIVGWANKFYKEYPGSRKQDFIGDKTGKVQIVGEIRNPNRFKDYIYPYLKESNERFSYLMDKLNDFLTKKDLGAFYTHPSYAKKSLELVREAIKRVPAGNDYIILDRCAGTGNLEENLTEEELGHTIVSTLEYYEYKVLVEKLGDKVRDIIPPTEKDDTFSSGLVRGADALSEEYINNAIIKQYVSDPKCTIILFENPPFSDTTSIEHQKQAASARKKSGVWKSSYVVQQMKKEVKGTATNDMGNAFIWSGFKYYLRQPTDSYIVYSPVKYWKAQHLINKKFLEGFAFNRRWFHRDIDACIMCALWSNEELKELEEIDLLPYDLDSNGQLIQLSQKLPILKIHSQYSQKYFDKRKFDDDRQEGILCSKDGTEREPSRCSFKPIFNANILGYMAVYSSGFDNPDNMASLLIAGRYDGHGFFLRKDNYLEKLPMFCASRYITYNRQWTERARIMKSGDGAEKYFNALKQNKLKPYLLRCLLFTVLEPQNHMRSFKGSDGRYYVNELCLDNTTHETIASHDLKELKMDEQEKELVELWKKILIEAKKTKNYKPQKTYGLYQIKVELNTTHKDEEGNTIFDYPILNGHIKSLAKKVGTYYNEKIVPTLFDYEFLK